MFVSRKSYAHIGETVSKYKPIEVYLDAGVCYSLEYNRVNLDDGVKITIGVMSLSGKLLDDHSVSINFPANRDYKYTVNLFKDGNVQCMTHFNNDMKSKTLFRRPAHNKKLNVDFRNDGFYKQEIIDVSKV